MSSQITWENIEALLAFSTLFLHKNVKLYDIQTEPLTLDPYSYSKEFNKFIASLYEQNFIISFAWTSWQDEAQGFITNPELLTLADISTLQKLFTTHVRQELFCSGHLAAMIINCHFLAIFNRLRAIYTDFDKNDEPKMNKQTSVIQGDITQLQIDAIVNAANEELMPGGGVCGAIHRAAGPSLWEECRQLKGCKTGEAKITKGYNLPAQWVIHTVGPVWEGGSYGEDELLASCYRRSLALAEKHQIKAIAFPAISTGVFGFPVERATKIAVAEVNKFLHSHNSVEQVIFVCFGQNTYDYYLKLMPEITES
ncbi:O-acetyl-ADP-ribose deacetylase [Calothrix sp. PCC 7507]|uniref:O-acetyl-ADP-ribose deacetylase n=1 Tax=Calothrix sp. PCC 7507 TaxID=99598 RepID=UPI00029EF9B8|nr:O-acetyl-ADP-ribose deacetylase [Calothrix sp. PCC 7507]AFY35494.1 Appr-1-p processing domain protein [Calothrix sp. PCC 7507]